ncbi:hypothetical protein EBZ80_06535 [bacterium]|nr:hypothetical protein [bacterium]
MKHDFYAPILRPPTGCSEPRRLSLHRVGAYSVVGSSTVVFVVLLSVRYDAWAVLLLTAVLGPVPLVLVMLDRIRLCITRPRWMARNDQYRDVTIL